MREARRRAVGGRGRGAQGGDQAASAQSLADWRLSATEATFKPVRKKIEDAGIHLGVLCYNMNATVTDDIIEYAFVMAKGLGVSAMSSSTTVSMAKRLAPFAEKHKLMVGFHNHDNTEDPNQMATEESFKAVLATSKYLGANFDIGHYVSANGDPVDFLKKYHGRVTNLHIKDRRRNHNGPIAWGQGDVPIKDVLQLVSTREVGLPRQHRVRLRRPGRRDPGRQEVLPVHQGRAWRRARRSKLHRCSRDRS